MTSINLLDWREKRRVVQNNRFFVMIGVTVFICMLLIFMLDGVIEEMIGSNQADVAYLTSELSPVEQKIAQIKNLQTQKDLLLARRQVIESLQDSRPFVVRIFDNLSRVVPAGVVLTQLDRKDDKMTISGVGNSNVDISEFIKNLQKLRWVNDAKLSEIKLGTDKSSSGGAAAPGSTGKSTQQASSSTDNRVSFKIEATLMSVDASVQDAAAKAKDAANPDAASPAGAPGAPGAPGAGSAKPSAKGAKGAPKSAPSKPGAVKPGAAKPDAAGGGI